MAVRSLRSLALGMSAVGALALAHGCVDDGVSLHVICPIYPALEGDMCTYDASGDTCEIEGILNLASAQYYRSSLRVESGLRSRSRDVPPQGEPNGLQLRSASVELRLPSGELLAFGDDVDGKPIQNPFEVAASGFVPPGGMGAITLTVVPAAHAARLQTSTQDPTPRFSQIVAAIKIKGTTNGEQEVGSGEYIWPIRLVSQSNSASSKQCIVKDYCVGALGQDEFAFACK